MTKQEKTVAKILGVLIVGYWFLMLTLTSMQRCRTVGEVFQNPGYTGTFAYVIGDGELEFNCVYTQDNYNAQLVPYEILEHNMLNEYNYPPQPVE